MNKKTVLGISYVSAWIIIWGTIGSLIDFYFLQKTIYVSGSVGQLSTFTITGAIATFIAVKIFPNINKKFID
tara:strand:- start:128 stop:343 length:216 start_codon:yes stop_codon:yes gene_type:complete